MANISFDDLEDLFRKNPGLRKRHNQRVKRMQKIQEEGVKDLDRAIKKVRRKNG